MEKNKKMDKQKYNRRRRIISCILSFSTFVASLLFLIFSVIISILYGDNDEVFIAIAGIVWLVYEGIVMLILLFIWTYKYPQYGKFTFADEFKPAKKYKYEKIDILDFFETELTKNGFVYYESPVDFIKGTYYYKKEDKKHYIGLFIEQPITKEIYNDYVNNYLFGFIETLEDSGMLEQWEKIYFAIIFKEDKDNKYVKEFIDYNLSLPESIGYLPILVDEEKKQISISNFDFGFGLVEYEEMKKDFLKYIDPYLIKKTKNKKS